MKIQQTYETNLGIVYGANCPNTQFYKIGDYVATFDDSKYIFEKMYDMNMLQLMKTDCVKAKVIDLFESYVLLGGNEENKLHFGKIRIEYENGKTITVSPNFCLLLGKVK